MADAAMRAFNIADDAELDKFVRAFLDAIHFAPKISGYSYAKADVRDLLAHAKAQSATKDPWPSKEYNIDGNEPAKEPNLDDAWKPIIERRLADKADSQPSEGKQHESFMGPDSGKAGLVPGVAVEDNLHSQLRTSANNSAISIHTDSESAEELRGLNEELFCGHLAMFQYCRSGQVPSGASCALCDKLAVEAECRKLREFARHVIDWAHQHPLDAQLQAVRGKAEAALSPKAPEVKK